MAYDPYGAQETQPAGFGPADFVSGTLKWHFTQRPSTWSGSKGVRMPFGINAKHINAFKTGISQGYEKSGFWGGVRGMFKGNYNGLGKGPGSRIGGWDDYAERLAKAQSQLSKFNEGVYVPKRLIKERSAIVSVRNKIGERLRTMNFAFESTSSVSDFMAGGEAIKSTEQLLSSANAHIGDLNQKISTVNETLKSKYNKRVTSLFKQRIARRVAKWGIRGMKAVSAVGATMLVGDVAMMVAEPVGRAIVERSNYLMERVSQRFMPETGGHLNAAYLSYGAATERQRAIQMISKGYINGRSAYGSEASLMHS